MNFFVFFCASFFSCLTILYAVRPEKSVCQERERAIAKLETAEDLLTKAEDVYGSYRSLISPQQSEIARQVQSAFIELSKKRISDVKENFPICPNIIVKDKPRDCSEISASEGNACGVHTIWPSEPYTAGKPLQVYCDMKTDNGGWTVIQRRGKFQVQQNFYQDWETYKEGFGNLKEEFWLGNENIRVLCHKGCEIRFDLQYKQGLKYFAVYEYFALWSSNYTLYIGGYSGTAGDAMSHINRNIGFSSKDKGFAEKVERHHGGWWYGKGNWCNLNGVYQPGKNDTKSVFWWELGEYNNLSHAEIKVRPK